MIRVGIVDDEKETRDKLQRYVENYFASIGRKAAITVYTDGAELSGLEPHSLDIILLDIQMAHMNGIEAARKLRERDEDVLIIFITNMVQFAIEGYSVDALDFVLKPVDEAAVARELDKAKKRLDRRVSPQISVRNSDGIFVLDADEIQFVETYDRHLIVHTLRNDVICSDTLAAMEKKLPDSFFRCHSACLVNLRRVERVSGNDIVIGKHLVPLSKHRKKEFMQAMTRYVKEIL